MRLALTAAAIGVAILASGTTAANAGGDRARDMCIIDLMRHDRAAPPAKAAPKKKAVKKAAAKKAPAKRAAPMKAEKKPLK